MLSLFYSESRLRAADKLRCNLMAVDAVEEAEQNGYEFPEPHDETIAEALAVLSQEQVEEEAQEVVEEELVYEWDEEYGESDAGCELEMVMDD